MSTTQTRDAENAATRALTTKVVAAVRPIADRIAERNYSLQAGDVSFEEVRTAIFMSTGRFARGIEFVRQADHSIEQVEYLQTFDRSIEVLLGYRLLVALGSKKWASHRRHFGYEEVVPLLVVLQPDPMKIPRECFRSALFHFWGFALALQDDLVDRLLPLIELLPKAVPLGELRHRPGVWRVLVA